MSIKHSESDHCHIITLQGDFDAVIAPEARSVFTELTQGNTKNVVLNFSNVSFMDSSGVGALVFLFKRLRESNCDLVLEGLQQQPAELIKLLRIDQIIETR